MATKKPIEIEEDSVLNDQSLDIDVASDEVEIVASSIDMDNKAVTAAAVIKNTAHDDEPNDKQESSQDSQEQTVTHGETTVFAERVAEVLSDETTDDQSQKEAPIGEKVQEKAEQIADDVKVVLDDKKAQLGDKLADTADTLQDKAQDLKQTLTDKKDNLSQKIDELTEQTTDKVQDKAQNIKEAVSQKTDDLIDSLVDVKQNAVDKFEDIKQTVADKADELLDDNKTDNEADNQKTNQNSDDTSFVDTVKDKLSEVKEQVLQTKDDAKDKLIDTNASAVSGIMQKVEAFKEEAGEFIENVREKFDTQKSALQDKVDDIKTDLADKKDDLTAKTETLKEDLIAKKDEMFETLKDNAEQAKQDADEYQKTHDTTGVSGRLAVLGAYFGSLYKEKSHEALDLTGELDQQAFKNQTGQIAQRLFGAKGLTAQKLASKVISDDKMSGFTDTIYAKIADFSQMLAQKELSNDVRFDKIGNLSDDEREQFADDIANQNRALATIGGVTGFFGLKGVVLDTAWLLLVSLKSVYQLAMIYDKPLTGKEGTKIAYGILSACDLDKLQQKQVIMTALALGNSVLVNAQSTGLSDELKKLGEKYQNRSYAKGFDELSKYVNLDNLNPKWLHWLMPIASTAVSTHYNNELIGEVLGVARATFAKREVTALLENKSNQKLPTDN